MDIKNRWGIPKITELAQEKFNEIAAQFLNQDVIDKWNKESSVRGYIAHNYPDGIWSTVVGFEPDPTFFSQITIGLAVDPDSPPEVLAKILVCREKSHEFFHIIWPPNT